MSLFAKLRPLDRRMQPRRKTHLDGRYMLSDKREYTCIVIDVSDSGLGLAVPQRGRLGERVIVYADALGRFAGEIVRHTDRGFALKLVGS